MLFILFIALFLFSHPAQASSKDEILDKAFQLDLAHQPTWLKLLHYEQAAHQSSVITNAFFLSAKGKTDPAAELRATIDAYFLPWGDNPNLHARCRYPARYYWLSQTLALPNYDLREEKCQQLQKWALFDSVKSVSVLLVSGYFGNPASTFGHTVLKFNTDSLDDRDGLFDLTLSYGAMVPDHENGVLYVLRGLFGGYKAGFSDKYFYTQDMTYTRTEFRDIWEYRLKLTDAERTLLMLHIWEIIGSKFNYYFLDKNCAYRLGELLELVIDGDLLNNKRFWYLPLELFSRLNKVDQKYHDVKKRKLVESVRYVPSNERMLYSQLHQLTPQELMAFNVIVRQGQGAMAVNLEKHSVDEKIAILDALLDYQQYRLIAEEPKPTPQRQEFKHKILLSRLQLAPKPSVMFPIKELPSPADGSPPMVMGTAFAWGKNNKSFLRLNWSPFYQETVGQNSLGGDELVIGDVAAGFFEREHKAFLDHLDLVRILKLKTLGVPIADDNQWSWQLRAGADRIKDSGENRYDGLASFGVGRAWKYKDMATIYGLIDFSGHSLAPNVRGRPYLGLRLDFGLLRFSGYEGVESSDYKGDFRNIYGLKLQYQLSQQLAVHVEMTNEIATKTVLGLDWYW